MVDTQQARMRTVARGHQPGEVRVVEVARPDRRSGEILVEVQAAALASDEAGEIGAQTPGRAGAGIVLFGAGSIVVGSQVGFGPVVRCRTCAACRARDRVRCERERTFGLDLPGALSEVVAIPRSAVVPLPSAVTPAEGAAALLHWPAALRLIRDAGGLEAGDRVAVLGADRPLGLAAVQLATAFNADIVPVETPSNGPLAGPLDAVLVAGGTPAAVIVALEQLRAGGTMAVAAGSVALERIDLGRLTEQQQRLVGSSGATEGDVRSIREWLATSSARPVIAGRYPLEHAGEALAHAARRPPGEVIVDVSEDG